MGARLGLPSIKLLVAAGCTLLIVAGLGLAVWRAIVLQQTAQSAREHLTAARSALSEAVVATSNEAPVAGLGQQQLSSACAEAAAAADSLRDVNGQLQTVMPLVGALESVPGIGQQARTQAATLQAGTQIASASTSLCGGLEPLSVLFDGNASDSGSQSTRDVMLGLVKARPNIGDAIARLEQLQASLDQIQDADLEPANRSTVVSMRQRLPQVVQNMQEAGVLLDLMGAQRPQRYLLVSQNPDELRATGGFIGSAGIVEADAGRIGLVEYGSSHSYDTPANVRTIPPAEFQAYLGQNRWDLAGANWWASYPDVARQLAYLYSLSHPGDQLDGVIALDQVGLARMLEVVGPVEVPQYGEQVSAADVQTKIDHYVHATGYGLDETDRKQFTAALSAAVLQRLLSAPRGSLAAVVKAVKNTLDQQHLLVWISDSASARLFATKHWDGALLPASADSLMILDTDVGSTKQSQGVTRDANYSVHLSDGSPPLAALELTYTNNSRPDQRPEVNFSAEYRTFVRVLVPAGANLTSSSGFDDGVSVGEECGRRVFSGQVTIGDQSRTSVKLDYQLPVSITTSSYAVLVQQQPGVPPGKLLVAVTTNAGMTARTSLQDAPGQHGNWQLDPTTATMNGIPLPAPSTTGCNLPVLQAQPLAPPVSVSLRAVDVTAPVVELGVGADGVMDAPPTPEVVGWYGMSSRPGQPGNSVMSGHVDWGKNTAVFWGLRNMHPGDSIAVTSADGVIHTYSVEWNETFPWQTAPMDRIVGPSSDSVLTLITCDGLYDSVAREYSARRVVRARLAD